MGAGRRRRRDLTGVVGYRIRLGEAGQKNLTQSGQVIPRAYMGLMVAF